MLVHRLRGVQEGGLVPHQQQRVALQLLHQLLRDVRPVPEGLNVASQVPRVYFLLEKTFELLNGRCLVLGLENSVSKLVEDEILLSCGIVAPLLQLELDDFVLKKGQSDCWMSFSQLKISGETLNSSITPAVVEVG